MRNKLLYIIISLAAWSCTTADEPVDPTPDDSRITVCGSTATLPMSSRATAPALDGICHADRMQVDVYRQSTTYKTNPDTDYSQYSFSETYTAEQLDGNADKSCSHGLSLSAGSTTDYHYVVRALAYEQADAAKFSYTVGAKANAASLAMNIPPAHTLGEYEFYTPELYYGYVTSTTKVGDDTGRKQDDEHGVFKFRNATWGQRNYKFDLSGHIYRIVGQINLQLTGLFANVMRIDILAEDLPKTIKLNPASVHGTLYPVEAVPASATGATVSGWTVMASKTRADFNADGSATISGFILPSSKGCRLKMRAYYREETDEGTSYRTKDFDLRPEMSVTFADVDKMYTSPTLKASEANGITSYYVYNNTTSRYFPFSNVRLNLKGSFDKVAFDSQEVEVVIEVEPGFVRKHEFDVI